MRHLSCLFSHSLFAVCIVLCSLNTRALNIAAGGASKPDSLYIRQRSAIKKGPKGPEQLLKINVQHNSAGITAKFEVADHTFYKELKPGNNTFYLYVPAVNNEIPVRAKLSHEGTTIAETTFLLRPVRQVSIFMMPVNCKPQAPNTDYQNNNPVQQQILQAAQRTDQSKHLPDEARFRFFVCHTQTLANLLKQAEPNQKKQLIAALRKAEIGFNGISTPEPAWLCSEEALFRLFYTDQELQGIKTRSVMVNDIHDISPEMIPVMSQAGIRYVFSTGTTSPETANYHDTITGPVYRVSPNGNDSVLFWNSSFMQADFCRMNQPDSIIASFNQETVFRYLARLQESAYNYDLMITSCCLPAKEGTDLSQMAANWNSIYESPKIILATPDEAFSAFEKKYQSSLPSVKDAFFQPESTCTGFGLIKQNQQAARLTQTETLFSMLEPANYEANAVHTIWKNLLKKNPGPKVTGQVCTEIDMLQQNAIKKSYSPKAEMILVANTCSWQRTGWVQIAKGNMRRGATVTSEKGKSVRIRSTRSGRMYFLAEDVPAFGSRLFKIKNEPDQKEATPAKKPYLMRSGDITVIINRKSGSIRHLSWKNEKINLADPAGKGLNHCLIGLTKNQGFEVEPRMSGIAQPAEGMMVIDLEAPGFSFFRTTIMLTADARGIRIINEFAPLENLESMSFVFPFHIVNGIVNSGPAQEPDNRNTNSENIRRFTPCNDYLDISGPAGGITWLSPDVPMAQTGGGDSLAEQTIVSCLQPESHQTRDTISVAYEIRFHETFDPIEASRAAISAQRPLIALPVSAQTRIPEPLFSIDDPEIISWAVRPKGNGNIITMKNCSATYRELKIKPSSYNAYLTDFNGTSRRSFGKFVPFPPFAIRHVYLENLNNRKTGADATRRK